MKRFLFFSIIIQLFFITNTHAEEGYASWYGGKFQGRKTANGEIFDTEKHTAAHKTIPFGTIVKVINLENGKTTVVRINDRGPFVKGRIIDLSRIAAAEIGMVGTGVARVRIEIVTNPETSNYYTIQVASFKDTANANRLAENLKSKGYMVSFERTGSGNIRVYLDFVEKNALENAKKSLAQMGYGNVIVRDIIAH